MIFQGLKTCIKSKAVGTLFWLLVATFCCAGLVFFLGSVDLSSSSEDISSKQLEFSPKPSQGKVIYYRYKDPKSVEKWSNQIDEFLRPYEKQDSNQIDCGFNRRPTGHEVCRVDLNSFKPCIESSDYGYSKASPCVFLKFKRSTNFIPEFLSLENITNSGLGYESSRFIREQDTPNHPELLKMIWTSCEGKTSFDNNLLGNVRYFPSRGFSGYFFPYYGQNGYIEPLVAVQFESPRIGIIIDVDCKVIALNFNETVSFKLLIEPE